MESWIKKDLGLRSLFFFRKIYYSLYGKKYTNIKKKKGEETMEIIVAIAIGIGIAWLFMRKKGGKNNEGN